MAEPRFGKARLLHGQGVHEGLDVGAGKCRRAFAHVCADFCVCVMCSMKEVDEMDGSNRQGVGKVEAALQQIRQQMPETYRAIQAQAGRIGNEAYRVVRRAAAGQPNLFWAVERGFVVGTPFTKDHEVMQAALAGVALGSGFVIVWGGEGARGA